MSMWRAVCWGLIGGSLAGCDRQGPPPKVPGTAAVNRLQSKLALDLTALDAAGLRGPADGKVAVAMRHAPRASSLRGHERRSSTSERHSCRSQSSSFARSCSFWACGVANHVRQRCWGVTWAA